MPLPRRLATALPAAALLLALGACTSGDEPEPGAEPSTPSTPLSEYAADTVVLDRAPFCEDITAGAVKEALAGDAANSSSYGNGEKARVTDDVRDVAHEFDCTYEAQDGTVARAWLFAPPVSPEQAKNVVKLASGDKGCRPEEREPGFGQSSAAMVCDTDGTTTASNRGLFGDAFLSCSIAVPAGTVEERELVDRAGRWCVQAAEAARTG